jgi:transcriptional regulator with XRE-family HTH domain
MLKLQVDAQVGAMIKVRRKSLGLTQAEFAEEIGVSQDEADGFERGRRRVSAALLQSMADVLRCEIADFFIGLPDGGGA